MKQVTDCEPGGARPPVPAGVAVDCGVGGAPSAGADFRASVLWPLVPPCGTHQEPPKRTNVSGRGVYLPDTLNSYSSPRLPGRGPALSLLLVAQRKRGGSSDWGRGNGNTNETTLILVAYAALSLWTALESPRHAVVVLGTVGHAHWRGVSCHLGVPLPTYEAGSTRSLSWRSTCYHRPAPGRTRCRRCRSPDRGRPSTSAGRRSSCRPSAR